MSKAGGEAAADGDKKFIVSFRDKLLFIGEDKKLSFDL